MPNWCNNQLTIIGDKAVLDRLVEFVKNEDGNDFSFDRIIPYPEPFHSMDKEPFCGRDGFNAGGYTWCVANWGTKWDAANGVEAARLSADRMFYTFDTAWSPFIPVVERLAGMFPELEFFYHFEEQGCCFAGDREYRDGELVSESDYEPQSNDEDKYTEDEEEPDEEAQASPGI